MAQSAIMSSEAPRKSPVSETITRSPAASPDSTSIFEIEDKAHMNEKMDDLISFVTSDRYAKLRKQIGIALG